MEFFHLVSVEEARMLFLQECKPDALTAKEVVPIAEALGRVVASSVRCPDDLPGFSRSSVDGYALRAADTFGASEGAPSYIRVVGEVFMGKAPSGSVRLGEAQRISTGGAIPQGCDAVVMLEYTEEVSNEEIGVLRPTSPGENVVQRGEDCQAGEELLMAGSEVRAQEIALLASAGVLSVEVFRRPRVAIISTGDELVAPTATPGIGQIRESNALALAALVQRDGGTPYYLGLAPDEEHEIAALLHKAMGCDVILISGGSSVGTRDLTAHLIKKLGSPGILVHGVKLKPGKPTILAVADGRPVVGLPGHPVSAQLVYELFVLPLLRQMQGLAADPAFRFVVRARLTKNVASAPGRTDCVRVRLFHEGTEVWAEPIHGKSSLISTLVRANGVVVVPSAKEGLLAGEWVEVEALR